MNAEATRALALALLQTAHEREESFDTESYKMACNDVRFNIVDAAMHYKKTIREAATYACKEHKIDARMIYVVESMLTNSHNDSLKWAENTLKDTP